MSEHPAAPEGFVRAWTPSPARGASEGPGTGETGHGHKAEDINWEQGPSAFPPHCTPNPDSCFFSGTPFAVSPVLLFQPPTSVSLPSIPCYGATPSFLLKLLPAAACSENRRVLPRLGALALLSLPAVSTGTENSLTLPSNAQLSSGKSLPL